MKISNKQELRQIASQNLSDIHFQDFINLYKHCTSTPYCFFFIIDNILASDNPSRFRKNLIEKI